MKTSMKLPLTFGLLFSLVLMSGCATDCGTCRGNGVFGSRVLQNQPIRSTIRSWFQGDECDTCNAPAGRVFPPNVAPLCDTCNTGAGQQLGTGVSPLYGSAVGGQLQSPALSGATVPSGSEMSGGITAPAGIQ